MRSNIILSLAAILTLLYSSCRSNNGGRDIAEGEIHYNVDYSGGTGPVPKEFLPQNMIVYFKNDKILFEMISPFGNSGIQNLNNPEKGIFDSYFSLFSIRYFYETQPGEMFPGFEMMQEAVIRKGDKKAEKCGFDCENAYVTFPLAGNQEFEIWFTKDISIENPNNLTPYQSIEGILMDFVFLFGPSTIHFTAENVYKKPVPDMQFERKRKFTRVSREDINKFINRMIPI